MQVQIQGKTYNVSKVQPIGGADLNMIWADRYIHNFVPHVFLAHRRGDTFEIIPFTQAELGEIESLTHMLPSQFSMAMFMAGKYESDLKSHCQATRATEYVAMMKAERGV
jgi:hypothetical protein